MTRLAARFAVGSSKPVELLIPLSTGSGKSRMPLGALLRIAASRAGQGRLQNPGRLADLAVRKTGHYCRKCERAKTTIAITISTSRSVKP